MTDAPIRQPTPLLLIALAATAAAAVLAAYGHGWPADMMLDSLTGVFAISGALFAGLRLALGMNSRQGRLLWQCILVIFLFVALGEFVEPYSEWVEDHLRLDDIDHLLLLALAPIALWFTSKLEPMPLWARTGLVVGFVVQAVATILDVSDDTLISGLQGKVGQFESYRDFAQFLSMQCYILAAFLTVAAIKVRQSQQGMGAAVEARIWPPAISPFAPARYRGLPIDVLRRSHRHAYWRSVPWWKIPLVVLATPCGHWRSLALRCASSGDMERERKRSAVGPIWRRSWITLPDCSRCCR